MNLVTRSAMAFVMMAPLIVSMPLTLDEVRRSPWPRVTSVHAEEDHGRALGGTVWGMIKRYTNSHIVVNGKTYPFHKHVVIDTFSLRRDDRGNVRLELDAQGKVTEVYFYGIDMPDVIRRYKM